MEPVGHGTKVGKGGATVRRGCMPTIGFNGCHEQDSLCKELADVFGSDVCDSGIPWDCMSGLAYTYCSHLDIFRR